MPGEVVPVNRRQFLNRRVLVCSGVFAVLLAADAAAQGTGSAALAASASIEQTTPGTRPALPILDAFDGLGHDHFDGATPPRNPSDNSLAVGPDHIVQTVNSQIAVFTKRGSRFDASGRLLFGPVATHAMFAGHGEVCGSRANGDAVVRYDQLADRWLVVMPIFRRAVVRDADRAATGPVAPPGEAARPGQAAHPGPPTRPAAPAPPPGPARGERRRLVRHVLRREHRARSARHYHRYAFERPLFPDYPRPAVWPDGYYLPTSTGDEVIEKHVCVADRVRMLAGEPASEQCLVIAAVNFLNTADLDGTTLPPPGAPNIVLATGGTQLHHDIDDDGIYAWQVHVDWAQPARTCAHRARRRSTSRPTAICAAASSPAACRSPASTVGSTPRATRSWRASCTATSAVGSRWWPCTRSTLRPAAAASAGTSSGSTGSASAQLLQQGTYAPDGGYRWMASPAIDRAGQHRHRLLLRRRGALPGPAHSPPAWPTIRAGVLTLPRERAGRGRGGADQHAALGGLHADGRRSERRLHDLVRGRLREEGRAGLLDPRRRGAAAGLRRPLIAAHIHFAWRNR